MASPLSLGILFTASTDVKQPDGSAKLSISEARIIATTQEAADKLQKNLDAAFSDADLEVSSKAEVTVCAPADFERETRLFVQTFGSKELTPEQKEAEDGLFSAFLRNQEEPSCFISAQAIYRGGVRYQYEAGGNDARSIAQLYQDVDAIGLIAAQQITDEKAREAAFNAIDASLGKSLSALPEQRRKLNLEGSISFLGQSNKQTARWAFDAEKPLEKLPRDIKSFMSFCFYDAEFPILTALATSVDKVRRIVNYGGIGVVQFASPVVVQEKSEPANPARQAKMEAIKEKLANFPPEMTKEFLDELAVDSDAEVDEAMDGLLAMLDSQMGQALFAAVAAQVSKE